MASTHKKYFMCLENCIFLTQYINETDEQEKIIKICNQDEKFNFSHYSIASLIFAFIMDMVLLTYSAIVGNITLFVASSFFSLVISPKLSNFLFKVFLYKFGNTTWKKAARTHAAIHMVINACEKYQRIPTIEEAKNSSWYATDCKSFSKEFSLLLYSTLFLFLAIFSPSFVPAVLISMGISLILNIIKRRLVFLERLILSKPTEDDIVFVISQLQKPENN